VLRTDPQLTAEHRLLTPDMERSPDKVLAFFSRMPLLYGDQQDASSYVCPMHPQVTASEPATCPQCGMKLIPATTQANAPAANYACPMHPLVTAPEATRCPECGMKLVPTNSLRTTAQDSPTGHDHDDVHADDHGDGLEWEDLMPQINRVSNPSNMVWQLIDRDTGAVNGAIDWAFTVGDRVKIRLINEMDSDHPMHHPFHIHGAGRFLILARDGEPESNLVWKDTVLVRAGQTVDILLEVTNPGLWMAHCHIAEHAESGMMFSFKVARTPEPVR
jgi:FtsP/CotA-like multicopper oxidase with cupredoxin domain